MNENTKRLLGTLGLIFISVLGGFFAGRIRVVNVPDSPSSIQIEALERRVDWLEKQEQMNTIRMDGSVSKLHDLEVIEHCKDK